MIISEEKNYRYRKPAFLRTMVDILLIPLMELITDGKGAHWWDWKPFDKSKLDSKVHLIESNSKWPQKRKFEEIPIFGKYNLTSVRDLYITLRVLPTVVVIAPVNFKGEWSLGNIMKGKYYLCNFLSNKPVKILVDGKRLYFGITKSGKHIPIKIIKTCSRKKYKGLLFV